MYWFPCDLSEDGVLGRKGRCLCLHFIFLSLFLLDVAIEMFQGFFFIILKDSLVWVLLYGFYLKGINIWLSDEQNYSYYNIVLPHIQIYICLQTSKIWFLSFLTSGLKELRWICLISKLSPKSLYIPLLHKLENNHGKKLIQVQRRLWLVFWAWFLRQSVFSLYCKELLNLTYW